MSAVIPSATEFEEFERAVATSIDQHSIVRDNGYTRGSLAGRRRPSSSRLHRPISVFSHLFIEAQLRKCINAPDLQSYRAGKEILMNELGVTFAPSGSVEGGTFRFSAGHFEWLAHFAEALGLQWSEIGKRRHGRPSTLDFCDALMSWYSAEDESTAAGASYAIEHWAAAGFWKELIAGLRAIKMSRLPDLPLGFWTWHDALEENHAAHTSDEMREALPSRASPPSGFSPRVRRCSTLSPDSGTDSTQRGSRSPPSATAPLIYLDEEAVRALLRWDDLIAAMEHALVVYSRGATLHPMRMGLTIEERRRYLGVMPAVVGDVMGLKFVTFYPVNAGTAFPTHNATIVLYRTETGQPLAAMDGRLITEMRTAAVSAAITKYLAPEGSQVLAILGSGVQAHAHLQALSRICEFSEVRVWSWTAAHAERFAAEHGVTRVESAEATVRGADVIVAATAARDPILKGVC